MLPSAQLLLVAGRSTRGRLSANLEPLSSVYTSQPVASCFRLFRQAVCWPLALAAERTGRSNDARTAIAAMTISNSMMVNAYGHGSSFDGGARDVISQFRFR